MWSETFVRGKFVDEPGKATEQTHHGKARYPQLSQIPERPRRTEDRTDLSLVYHDKQISILFPQNSNSLESMPQTLLAAAYELV